jgi:hypothetical protein
MICNRCGYTEDNSESLLADVEVMLDHIRVMHPDDYEEPERWPDGSLVVTVEEDSLTPENVTDWPIRREP